MAIRLRLLTIATVLCLVSGASYSQDFNAEPSPIKLKSLLDDQAIELAELRKRLDRYESLHKSEASGEPFSSSSSTIRRLPVVVEEEASPSSEASSATDFHALRFVADYEDGFVIRSVNPSKLPFELNISGWIQFRYHGFASDVDSWTDNAGITRPVRNRNAFDIERARLVLAGHAQDRRLTYFLQLDGDTDGGDFVDFFDYWWGWEFSDDFQVQMGKRKVPASRQWILGARRTRFIDRPMANDFFRPDRTVGIFGVGKVGETGHYEVMVGNGYRTANLSNAETDNRFAFAATNYFDWLGDYGGQIVDYECSGNPLVRFGHSFVFSLQPADPTGFPSEETDFIRLTDGTRLTQSGALAPGVTVSDFDIFFYGLDAAVKWLGWSVNAELFLQWIENIEGDGPLPLADLYRHGGYLEGGYFLVPKKLDFNLRYSRVNGRFGNASEYAAGTNWYPLDSPNLKLSFDVTILDGSPLQNTASDILVGDDGVLFRTQFQAEF